MLNSGRKKKYSNSRVVQKTPKETAIILINCIGTKQRNIPLHTLIIQ